jgi:hypothetical protein
MLLQPGKHRMTDLSSVTSSAVAIVTKPVTALNNAASAASTSFASTLSKVQTAVGIKPKTGFTAGPTYEANTLTGQTKAAFNATKAAFGIKP